jgi:uncharacterized protein YfaP (DUF2135 family)
MLSDEEGAVLMFGFSMKIRACLGTLLGLIMVLSPLGLIQAQDEVATRTLTPGTAVQATLDADNPVQVYSFSGTAGQNAGLSATVPGGGIVLHVTDASGTQIDQAIFPNEEGNDNYTAALDDMELPRDGLYYVTILPLAYGEQPTDGDVELTLTLSDAGTSTTPIQFTQPGQVLTTGGLQVSLTWNTTADMNLQVRDPIGETLYWDSRTTSNGGQFGDAAGYDANGLCQIVAPSGTERATWPGGAITTGRYEILVFYRQACENSGPTDFTVNVLVDGAALPAIEGTLQPPVENQQEQVFITSFLVGLDGAAEAGASGVYSDTTSLPQGVQPELANPEAITLNTPVQGSITTGQPFQTFAFTGQANEIVSINMNRISGSLDTSVLLLNSSGSVVSSNDDSGAGITDSFIRNVNLPTDGTYTVVATRYGKELGGTEGIFELTLTGPTEDLPQAVRDLNLPTGDIQISLTWDTGADLQLLVRDPAGASVFDDTPTIDSGGRLAASGNVNCTRTQDQPVSYIYWPESFARPGSYEVEIWYQNQCNDLLPVEFALNIVVNGQLIFADVVRPLPNQRYVTSFTIDVNEQVQAGQGGLIGNSTTLNYQSEVATATQLIPGQAITGNITPDNKFDVYVFEGQAGDTMTISMETVAGTLDTTLFLIDPGGIEVASNDDAVPNETTDSLISQFTLPSDGQYVVIATHFGTIFGGTTGTYNLILTQVN